MFRQSVTIILLAAACSAMLYPRFEMVVRDPSVFDLLYSTTAGAHNETWYFKARAKVSGFVIPTQASLSSGPEANGTYTEDVELLIYETPYNSAPYLVGNGSYSGQVSMGQALHVPVVNTTTGGELSVKRYITDNFYYILIIQFKTSGIYPWYETRKFSTYSVVSADTDVEGLALGVSFSSP